MIHFALLFSRQGKVRLSKYYVPYSQKERAKLVKEVTASILSRPAKLCNVVEHRQLKLVYKRYASLYFALAVDDDENELIVLEMIQHYVEILDRYFGSVCELDLIYNFHKAYFILRWRATLAMTLAARQAGLHCSSTQSPMFSTCSDSRCIGFVVMKMSERAGSGRGPFSFPVSTSATTAVPHRFCSSGPKTVGESPSTSSPVAA